LFLLPSNRRQHLALAPLLVGSVLGFDLLWALAEGSTDTVAYGLLDEPAHLATCAIGILALAAIRGRAPSARFSAAALLASVAIDVDHIPGYLGSHVLTGSSPRPYSHSAALVLLLLLGAACSRRRERRQIWLGLGFGVAMHLFRDLATGPGIPLLWPISQAAVGVPYALYAAALVGATLSALAAVRRLAPVRRVAEVSAAILVAAVAIFATQPEPAPASGNAHVSVGAYIPHVAEDPGVVGEFAQQVGRPPAILSFYQVWDRLLLTPEQEQAASANGAVPMITWEPWTEDERGISLWGIANGEQDAYVRSVAQEAATWGQPILLRFAHEMNGNWYPWGWGVDGNTPAAFKAAWRHVVEIFREEGASNVRWVWCPSVSNTKLSQFKRFYPGDEWVDWVGLDGFNWGAYGTWQSFNQIFALSYQRLLRFTDRPIMIGEIGVNQAGGSKPRWISRTLRRVLPRYRNVRAVVWFDASDGRADFRIDSSAGALAAFRHAMGMPYFGATARQLLSVPARLRPTHHKHRRHRGGRVAGGAG